MNGYLTQAHDVLRDWHRPAVKLDVLESRLLLSSTVLPAPVDVLGPAGGLAPPAIQVQRLGFDGDTSAFNHRGYTRVNLAGEDPIGDGTPIGESYMLYENWGGTWTDAEKLPNNYEDDLMCWAAAASNALEWTGWGLVDGMTRSDDMFEYFQDHWTDEGGLMEFGWDWWFDGTNDSQGWSGWSQVDVPGGGFYPTENFSEYYHRTATDSAALSAINSYMHSGYGTTLGIYTATGGGHAITCWGYNYNPDNPSEYYGIWVTDSDDSKSLTNPPDTIHYYEVAYSGTAWYLQSYYGSNAWYIGEVQALEPYVEPLPTVTIEATDAEAAEAPLDTGTVTVSRTGPATGSLEVFYTIAGSAANGSDYQTISDSVVIPDGSVSATILITPIDDVEEEGNETAILTLTGAATYTVGTQDSDTVNIANDDLLVVDDLAVLETSVHGSVTAGDLTATHVSDNAREAITEEKFGGTKSRLEQQWTFEVSGGSVVTFSVEAHHNSSAEDFSFEYSTDGTTWTQMLTVTKTSDNDQLQSCELAPGTSGTVYVRVVDTNRDRKESSLDTIFVDRMVIQSDLRVVPTISLAATDAAASETGPDTGTFTITRADDLVGALEVLYTVSGTAANGTDYDAIPTSVIFADGQETATVTITPVDDDLGEGNETVILTLAESEDYRIATPGGQTVTIADNDVTEIISRAEAETTITGEVTGGSYTSTHASDNTYEAVTEGKYRGKGSSLEQQWSFNVAGGDTVTFSVEAYHNSSVEDFAFEYSTDGGLTWTHLLTVTKNADDDIAQSATLDPGTTGTVLVRVVDTDRSRTEGVMDTVFIDDMYIVSEFGG